MSPILESLFASILTERAGIADTLPIYAASEGQELPESFACVTVTDPAAPEEGYAGLTHTVTLSVCCPIDLRAHAEAIAGAFLCLTLSEIATAATARYQGLSRGHLYAWRPGLSSTDLTEGNRLILTATAELTCARFSYE